MGDDINIYDYFREQRQQKSNTEKEARRKERLKSIGKWLANNLIGLLALIVAILVAIFK